MAQHRREASASVAWSVECLLVQEGTDLEAAKQQLRERHGIHVWVSPLSSTRIDMEARGLQVQRNHMMGVRTHYDDVAQILCEVPSSLSFMTLILLLRFWLQASIRSSVHWYNNEEEVDKLIAAAHML